MYFPHLLLKRIGPFLDWNDKLDYSRVVCFQIIICPCEHIPILFKQADKGLLLLLCATHTEIDELQIFFSSHVNEFVHHGKAMSFVVPWCLETFLQVIELFQSFHTLREVTERERYILLGRTVAMSI